MNKKQVLLFLTRVEKRWERERKTTINMRRNTQKDIKNYRNKGKEPFNSSYENYAIFQITETTK